MKNFVQEGGTLTLTALADGSGGDLVMIGDLPVVALSDHKAGEQFAGRAEGVVRLPGKGNAIGEGDIVYSTGDGMVTGDPTGAKRVGFADSAKGAGNADLTVKLWP